MYISKIKLLEIHELSTKGSDLLSVKYTLCMPQNTQGVQPVR